MNGMKYLVFSKDGIETIYIFQACIEHRAFAACMDIPGCFGYGKPIRGGFVYFVLSGNDNNTGKLQCRGESFSLGLQSDREKDTKLLLQQISF